MPAVIRGTMGLVSQVLIAVSVLFIFFVILSGLDGSTPLDKTYFLRADTSSIAGARSVSQWTYFYICGDGNNNCGSPVPALPVGYAWVGGGSGAPASLLGSHGKGTTSKYFYYMWRFGWVFYLMALVFDVLALFASLLAPCSRLASGFGGTILMIALFWMSLAAPLMTATFVKMRDAFRNQGIDAHIGTYAFAWTWAAWAAMFLATITLFLGCGLGGERKVRETEPRPAGSLAFWRRQRGNDSTSDSQRRVKDDYA